MSGERPRRLRQFEKMHRSYFQREEITRGCLDLVTLTEPACYTYICTCETRGLSLTHSLTHSFSLSTSSSLPFSVTLVKQTSASKEEKEQRKETKYYTSKRWNGQMDRRLSFSASGSVYAVTLFSTNEPSCVQRVENTYFILFLSKNTNECKWCSFQMRIVLKRGF